MEVLTFKRRGYTDTIEAHGKDFYIEYHHLSGEIKIVKPYDIIKEWNGKKYAESHTEVLYYGKTNYKGEYPLNAITEIKELIKVYCNVEVEFNDYVKAYDTRKNFYNKIYPYLNHDLQSEDITS